MDSAHVSGMATAARIRLLVSNELPPLFPTGPRHWFQWGAGHLRLRTHFSPSLSHGKLVVPV